MIIILTEKRSVDGGEFCSILLNLATEVEMQTGQDLAALIIQTIRTLSMDAVQQANSGHPGAPMGLAPLAYTIWDRFLKFNPRNPDWPDRDRFILSAGHASMLLYSMLHLTGYDISIDDIKNFRQLHSKCAGHPEYGLAPGVESTTGPLGQGVATSVGMAIAEKWLASYFNRDGHQLIHYDIYAIAGDGCMMEGISGEAASLAGHLGLDNLIWFYDSNNITIEGNTKLAFTEDVARRFEAYGWFIQHVDDANDVEALATAIQTAKDETDRPSLIIIKSHIAYGSPNKQDHESAHGSPLGAAEVKLTKQNLGWDPEKFFYIPKEIQKFTNHAIQRGRELEESWNRKFDAYEKAYPELAHQFKLLQTHQLPDGWQEAVPQFAADVKGIATRSANGKILNKLFKSIPWLLGGSADLAPSTKTYLDGEQDFRRENPAGRNFRFGVREHAMGAILNGLALSKLRPFGGTFLVFSDYMRPAIRLAALMEIPVIYVFTHDSIGVGEDGPTHQPVEQITSLRLIPNLIDARPADANELSALWSYILTIKNRPTALFLSRQDLPILDRSRYASASEAIKGAYILSDSVSTPQAILLATGSEVAVALKAQEVLNEKGIAVRVVSMPSWYLFEQQPKSYRDMVLPPWITVRIAIEAGSAMGWERYTGNSCDAHIIGLTSFGLSAPIDDVMNEFGLTVENVVRQVTRLVK